MVTTPDTGLAATFFTVVYFTAAGFMIRLPLDKQGGKAVIRYLVLGAALALAQDVLGDMVPREPAPGWWLALLYVVAVGALVKAALFRADTGRRDGAAKMAVCILLILFCMGVSYIASASLAMLTGLTVPWPAAGTLLAALVRNTTGMTGEEFPDAQGKDTCKICVYLMAALLVLPA